MPIALITAPLTRVCLDTNDTHTSRVVRLLFTVSLCLFLSHGFDSLLNDIGQTNRRHRDSNSNRVSQKGRARRNCLPTQKSI